VTGRMFDDNRLDLLGPSDFGAVLSWLGPEISTGEMLVLIDEIESGHSPRATELLATVRLSVDQPGPRVIVSMAPELAEDWNGWQQAHLDPLSPDLVANWARTQRPEADSLLRHEGLLELLDGNPLLWSTFIAAGDKRGFTGIMLELISARISSRMREGFVVTAKHLEMLLHLAAAILDGGYQALDEGEVDTIAHRILEHYAERPWATVWARADILCQQEGRWRFCHPVDRDYFAGAWLSEQHPSAEELIARALDPTWREPTAHALALLPPSSAADTLLELWTRARTLPPEQAWLIRSLAVDAGSQGTPRQRKQALEQARAALEQAQADNDDPQLWEALAERLLAAEGKPS
ncbi:MAG: hypothetical protein KC457_30445, partial [Myxococcales bacterium]|nr:hypothetical protein [Myxococcales bacterium]